MLNWQTKIARTLALCIALWLLTLPSIVDAQSNNLVADLAARINRERIVRGLTPYALNTQLTAAAQAHANDLAQSGKMRNPQDGHVGTDGSTVFDRVARTNYGAFSWGRRLGENWAHYQDVATAFQMWMESTPHRANILHALYREIGIGVAPSALGGYVFVVDFGAQPNVLPIFINDTATETASVNVTLTLNDEQVQPNGDGTSTIGHPIEIQISNSADFANAQWQPYVSKINWTLTPGAGTKTVYVKYRDAKGRTATAFDSITLIEPGTPSPTATRTTTRTPTLTRTRTSLPTDTATITPSSTNTPTATPTSTPTLTTIPTLTATSTPSVAETMTMAPTSAALGAVGLATAIAILVAVTKEILNR
jgi:uncharacterized protein YkwD